MPTKGEGDRRASATRYAKLETPRHVASDIDSDSDNASSRERSPPAKSFVFSSLYRYATPLDKALLALGVLMATVNGALFPMMAIVFGNVLHGFVVTPVDLDAVNAAALDYFVIALGLFGTDYVAYVAFYYTAERQMKALRTEALQHMLYLDIAWYDQHDALQLSSRLTGDTVKIKEGMGQKLGDLFRFSTQFLAGVAIGFTRGWDIALAMAAVMPAMALSLAWLIKTMRAKSEWAQRVYAEAGAVAEETLAHMRTVASLNAERRAVARYNAKTAVVEAENLQLAKYVSGVLALFLASVWVMYAVGLWYGGNKVSAGRATPTDVFQAFFGILLGSGSLAQISPNLTAVAQATGAAQAIFRILDTPSAIDASQLDVGDVPAGCKGAIEVCGVHFAYPSRPDAPVLVDFSVSIAAGETVAFVGASGGGKSTLVALLERFYDPTQGEIRLDGRPLRALNVRWLRAQIGIVQQEPVLFQTTIWENIAAGGRAVTRAQAEAAAKMANAHAFILRLPQQYDTLVGEKGVSLSGGQKQRVAIARAIVRSPKILVLDEATSALDNESERVVQAALNELMATTNMTTLVIAHRLSTVRHADQIVVLSGGRVVERGVHDELLALPGGIYRTMFAMQQLNARASDDDDEQAADCEGVARVEDDAPLAAGARRESVTSATSQQSLARVETNELVKPTFSLLDVLRLSRPERKVLYLGMVGAAAAGFALPASALLVSGMIASMTEQYGRWLQDKDRRHLEQLASDVARYGVGYLVGAVLLGGFTFVQYFSFKFVMEKLVTRLRGVHFRALCRQNVGFFDDPANATGALTADLNTNATKVALLSGDAQARLVQAFFTLTAAVSISFATGSWLLTLVLLAVFPLLVGGQLIRVKQIRRRNAISDELAEPGALASERLRNIRTVVALGLEPQSAQRFAELLEGPLRQGHAEAQINAVALGFSSFIMMAVYALAFWLGGQLVHRGAATFGEVIRTLMAITMSLQGVTGAASYLGDSAAACKAGATILALRDRAVPIDAFADADADADAGGLQPASVRGQLSFRAVSFRYPTRPQVSVLQRCSLEIDAGQTVAFCGPSGGGKSTVVALLERFYDPTQGEIRLDGHDLRTLHVRWLRAQLGLVGQEPVLFSGTIADNIAYGLEARGDDAARPTPPDIERAARLANAHDFVTRFPDGYATQVGAQGEQLSGGQKQRLAIARAILKAPAVLLLDEATSALDSESERVVQDALDKLVALQRRTTVIIAHRLATIRKADKIYVLRGGGVAEQGTHAELLARGGLYARLVESGST
ncbi:hypothetical protein P43SY_008456 [Pythium insidiosum]|uniref:Multidrug resistance protein ABC superfamily n=1 Tax=Pythium insidiosum TaxID=114742 RepID=A0AAD5QF83_PYTIN|nr:hypothetical protein P43SY_008456 [Pythium insidiosum]